MARVLTNVAFVFAGQGAQAPGMGQDIATQSPAAAHVFEIADELRPNTSTQCFSGTKEELSITINTQPCLLAVDLACGRALEELGVYPAAVAGFSLGELAALAFADVISDATALELVMRRAQLMDFAAIARPGAMAAVVGQSADVVNNYLANYPDVIIANYNCATQQVISGDADQVASLLAELKAAKVRAISLAVSGGFHSPLMSDASRQFGDVLQNYHFATPAIPAWANQTARPYSADADEAKATLAAQICDSVYWEQSVLGMVEAGIDTFVECGAGKVLSGLIAKIAPDATVMNVSTYEEARACAVALGVVSEEDPS